MPASQSALLHGPEHFLRWGYHSMSSCDGVRPIVVEPVQFFPKGSPIPHVKAPANPISQGTSPITGLVYAAICGTKKYLSIFCRAGEGVPNVVMVLLQFWVFGFALPETLRRHFLRAVAAAAFFVLVAAATSASCRGTSQQNIRDIPRGEQTPVPLVQRITIIGVPVVKQHQVPTIQTDRKTVEVHQSQQTDRVVDVLIVTQQQVPMFQKVQKTPVLTSRTVQTWRLHRQYIEGWCICQVGGCVRTVGCATDSVLQQRYCQSSCVLQRTSPLTLHPGVI